MIVPRGSSQVRHATCKLPGIILLFCLSLSTGAMAGTETVLYDFQMFSFGQFPSGSLISDGQGNLYGTTANGGAYDCGAVYMLSPGAGGGWVETVLYSLKGSYGGATDGCSPDGALVADSAGNLYGATTWGGTAGVGSVFKLTRVSSLQWTEQTLWSFQQDNPRDGFNAQGGLVFDKAGNLYGTTRYGGGYSRVDCSFDGGCGTIFRLSPQASGTWKESLLYIFQGNQDGAYPNRSLILDTNGNVFGTSSGFGYSSSNGTVFELMPTGHLPWTLVTLHTFSDVDGKYPRAGLIFDQAGSLYGTTAGGGGNLQGTVFQLTPASGNTWTETVLHSFNGTDGDNPEAELLLDREGNLFGTTSFGGNGKGVAFELSRSAQGWSETVLWTFSGRRDGLYPHFRLLQGASGELYGATSAGFGGPGNGTVFRLRKASGSWHLITIAGFEPADGGVPNTSLVADGQGHLYGSTSRGGVTGLGTVFELAPLPGGGWKKTELYHFGGVASPTNSYANPSALILDASGTLYGETAYDGPKQKGTVFRLSRVGGTWVETDIFTFSDSHTGENPFGGLVLDAAGNLYGTTLRGGITGGACKNGCGTVFRLSPSSGDQWTETVLYQFQSGSDGAFPQAGLIFDSAGNLFGTTRAGGLQTWPCRDGCGTVFELVPQAGGAWSEKVLHRFAHVGGDGSFPWAGLTIDSAGNLFGAAAYGGDLSHGTYGWGTLFELSPAPGGDWTENVIHTFGASDGASPLGTLVLDSNGNLFGTTSGKSGGTVFELSPGQGHWTHTMLYQFPAAGGGDGYFPQAGVILDGTGNLLGTTAGGGQGNSGRVFKITP